MNRLELVEKVAQKTGLTKSEVASTLTAIIEEIKLGVKEDGAVNLIGFGSFKLVDRPARTGRNPATGATIEIPAVRSPKFLPSSAFKALVNEKAE